MRSWLFAVLMGICGATLCSAVTAQTLSRAEILDKAQERIEQHRKADATLILVDADGAPIKEGTEVVIEQQRHRFLFGCNLFMFDRCRSAQDNALYLERFKELFNFATLGFYWNAYEPRQDNTAAQHRRRSAEWCRKNEIIPKGHPLVWTLEPGWVHALPTGQAEERLWFRIQREMNDFQGLIEVWDVLNEPCVGIRQGTERNAKTAVRLYETLGTTGIIKKAFIAAEAANPKAMLILNDYDVSPAYEKVIEDCLADGVRIDVIGVQSHMHGGVWEPEKLWDVCERFGRFNKPVHFTEATIVSGPGQEENWQKTSPALEKDQERDAVMFYTVLFSHPAVEAITWWDFSDQGAWQQAPAGLIGEDMTPKPAYAALKKLIKEDWWTRTTATVGPQGRVRFRGFLGDYGIRIKDDGSGRIAAFSLEPKAALDGRVILQKTSVTDN